MFKWVEMFAQYVYVIYIYMLCTCVCMCMFLKVSYSLLQNYIFLKTIQQLVQGPFTAVMSVYMYTR